jgi:hypothetical protein
MTSAFGNGSTRGAEMRKEKSFSRRDCRRSAVLHIDYERNGSALFINVSGTCGFLSWKHNENGKRRHSNAVYTISQESFLFCESFQKLPFIISFTLIEQKFILTLDLPPAINSPV